MSKHEIYERTMAAIEDDIVELKIEFSNLRSYEYTKQVQVLQAIQNAREIIDELKQEKQEKQDEHFTIYRSRTLNS